MIYAFIRAVERATILSINLLDVIKIYRVRYINEKHIVSLAGIFIKTGTQ
ncbi:hypothetical protein CLV42_105194 [Chitinophaga ginsengisoli]|uniref:Uncharacterized protein n=1 Tax=Chitinophaga ginsengisoli TaxID=363837 RepID=A0A2P8GA44_9BACT|nr:hypothetical protein CLV42_105194 [Chitinophaga ginsengisoli]